jgi:hypothetical protein
VATKWCTSQKLEQFKVTRCYVYFIWIILSCSEYNKCKSKTHQSKIKYCRVKVEKKMVYYETVLFQIKLRISWIFWRPICYCCYFSMNDVSTFLYISINSLILKMVSKLISAFYSYIVKVCEAAKLFNCWVCYKNFDRHALKFVFLKHYLSTNKANFNNKIIEGVQ